MDKSYVLWRILMFALILNRMKHKKFQNWKGNSEVRERGSFVWGSQKCFVLRNVCLQTHNTEHAEAEPYFGMFYACQSFSMSDFPLFITFPVFFLFLPFRHNFSRTDMIPQIVLAQGKIFPKIFWALQPCCCWKPYFSTHVLPRDLKNPSYCLLQKVFCKCKRSQLSFWSWWPDCLNSLCFTNFVILCEQ